MSNSRTARGIVLAAILVASATALPARADTDVYGEILIHKYSTEQGPTHDAPSGWTCGSQNSGGHYTVTCDKNGSAPDGDWVCPGPYVLATYVGSPLDTHWGTSSCGDTSADCSPQQIPLTSGFCDDSTAGPDGMDFVCDANMQGLSEATTEWTVLCRTYTE